MHIQRGSRHANHIVSLTAAACIAAATLTLGGTIRAATFDLPVSAPVSASAPPHTKPFLPPDPCRSAC
jgi:hypothetical protein